MRYLASHERAMRGTFDFPIELYYVDKHHPRYEMPFHWHMEHELILVLQGVLNLSVNGEACTLREGDCLLIADGAIHGGTPQDCVYECVVLDLERFLPVASKCGQRLAQLRADGARLQGQFSAGSRAAELASRLFEAMETEGPGYEFTTTGLLWQLFGEIMTRRLYHAGTTDTLHQERRTQAVKKVLQYIRANFSEPLTLEELAREAELAPRYLCRIFRQVTGRTPIEYLNYYRIECAAELLCTTADSITDIALQCGFGDVSYFSRVFRRLKNEAPGEYRRAYKGLLP